MPRGAKPGERRGGRAKGRPNKRTTGLQEAQQQAAQKLAEALGESCFEGDAHALLMAVYKDKTQPIELRVDAAKAAVGYEKPRLQATEHKGSIGVSHEERLSFLDGELPTEIAGAVGNDPSARH